MLAALFILSVFISVLLLVLLLAAVSWVSGFGFRKTFLRCLWLLLLPPAIFLYGYFERNQLDVNEICIFSENIPPSFDGYRIVQISDLHLDSYAGRSKSLSEAVSKINGLDPDMIAFTGDLVTSHPSEAVPFMDILNGLRAPDGIFSVMGNHDYCIYRKWDDETLRESAVRQVREIHEKLGWNLLENSHADITRISVDGKDEKISIIGVENISASPYFPSYGNLPEAMEGAGGRFRILLSHDPSFWRQSVAGCTDIGLTLSGHTHAMQLSLFGLSPSSFIFDEYRGLYRYENAMETISMTGVEKRSVQYLYVNIGLGETLIPARVGARPELTVIILKRECPEGGQ